MHFQFLHNTPSRVLQLPLLLCNHTLAVPSVDDSKGIKQLLSIESMRLNGVLSFVIKSCSEILHFYFSLFLTSVCPCRHSLLH
jgi:hypothetical protein